MKKVFHLIIISSIIIGCSRSIDPAKKAVRLVRTNYPDCEKIISVDVDTITLGDKLDYRISRQIRQIEYAESQVQMYKGFVNEFRGSKKLSDGYKNDLQRAEEKLERSKKFLAALDSLKQATLDIANTPAAYEICVAYNYYSNKVWIQLDADGTFLTMSKSITDLLLNPGEDMPGYDELLIDNLI